MSMLGIIASQNVAFIPNKLSGLKLWLDASDIATVIESGGNVSQWNDKSVSGNNATQPTGSVQPVFLSNGINGKGALEMVDSSTQFMTLNTSIVEGDLTAIAVFVNKFPSATPAAIGGILGGPAGINIQLLRYDPDQSANGSLTTFDGTNQIQFDLPSSIQDIPVIIATEFDTAVGQKLYLDGVLKVTGAYVGTIDARQIGKIGNFLGSLVGRIGEIIVYDRILVAAELLQLNNYLSNKWGITL